MAKDKKDKRHSGTRKATTAKAGKRSKGKGRNKTPKYQQQGRKFSLNAVKKDRERNPGQNKKNNRAPKPKNTMAAIAGDQIEAIKQQKLQEEAEKVNKQVGGKFDAKNRDHLEKLGLIKRNKK